MASNRVLEFIVGVKDRASSGLAKIRGRIADFAKGVGTNLMNIKAGFDMAMGAVRTFANGFARAIKEAFAFEKAVTDFKVLLGSIKEAKSHIAELKSFAASTPLTFGDLSRASKLLLSFGSDIQDVMPSLKMLGDIAMGDAQKFQGLALVFAQVKSQGKLMGQDLLQMVNQGFNPLTIIAKETGKSVGELKDMMSEGAISFEMVEAAMRSATSAGGLFNNAMQEASTTGEGLLSTLEDNWTEAVRTFGEAFSDAAKNGVGTLSEKLQELTKDGTIKTWAETTAEALTHVVNGFTAIGNAINAVYKYSGMQDVWNFMQGVTRGVGDSIGAMVGTAQGGGNLWDVIKAGFNGLGEGIIDEMDDDAFYWKKLSNNPNISDPIKSSHKVESQKSAKTEIKNEIEDAHRTIKEIFDEIESEEEGKRLEKKVEEEKKLAQKRAEEEAKRLEAEEKERLRIEKAIADERDKLRRAELQEYQNGLIRAHQKAAEEESEALVRLADAEAKERQAWGWYRDRDSWKAQLAEEKAEAEAQKQFEYDFKSLKNRRYNWRTAKLDEDDELIRRVALAKEEKAAAEEYAKITAEATQAAAEKLEQIESYFAQGGE